VVELNPFLVSVQIGISKESVQKVLEFLASPDPASRSKQEEGRRIERISEYSYKVINYSYYRSIRTNEDRKQQNRLAQKRFRDKKSSGVIQDSNASSGIIPERPVCQPMQKQMQKQNKEIPPPPFSRNPGNAAAPSRAKAPTSEDQSSTSRKERIDELLAVPHHHEEWLAVRTKYPRGTYRITDWLEAEREATYCVQEGLCTWIQWREAVDRYATQVRVRGGSSQFVLSPRKWFHRDSRSWAEPFQLPEAGPTPAKASLEESERKEFDRLKSKAAQLGFRAPWPADTPATYETALREFERNNPPGKHLNGAISADSLRKR